MKLIYGVVPVPNIEYLIVNGSTVVSSNLDAFFIFPKPCDTYENVFHNTLFRIAPPEKLIRD